MEFKEFSFGPEIRVCLYTIGDEGLDYHCHTNISDITYCSHGEILIELLDQKKSVLLKPGQLFQVPAGQWHRCIHYSKNTKNSSYVLLQVGEFNIDFLNHQASNFTPVAFNRMDLKQTFKLKNTVSFGEIIEFFEQKTGLPKNEKEQILRGITHVAEEFSLEMSKNQVC